MHLHHRRHQVILFPQKVVVKAMATTWMTLIPYVNHLTE